jgi:hypothetical protein
MDGNNNDMKDKKGRKFRVSVKRKRRKTKDGEKEKRRRRRDRRTGIAVENLSNRFRFKRFEVSTAVRAQNVCYDTV